jgi:hypothetical protein
MWHGMIEIVISWSMFGQTMDAAFLIYMTALGILKAFHWLIQDRINFMQTEPHITVLQHTRTISCLLLLLVCPFAKFGKLHVAEGSHYHLQHADSLCLLLHSTYDIKVVC